ncbi:hypothetical protein EQG79_28555 [Spirosoma sordidisoli]|uniref:Uncharacterized protein n=1 Tax=Spirosoma sordidisoli TaxID=2502893 RepID=A0A4Q2UH74_9BACT|nr:hypothetical protein EQG79_28555 [Spirosoma sordidisoli]
MSCQQNSSVEPDFPLTKAYYSFRVFRPTDPRQPRNEVGFDTLAYRAEDGSIRILTNRTVYFTNEYDTTIYANVPADRVLEGYLSARKAQNVTIEVGLIDKSGAKQKQDYRLVGVENQDPTVLMPVRVKVRTEVPLADVKAINK